MSTTAVTSLRLTRVIGAAPARVFEAWTRPEHLARWSCPEGATLENVEVDLRVGGSYKLHMRTEDGLTHTAFGTYREIDAPNKLVYTWDWEEEEYRVGKTVVTVLFKPTEDGGTEVVLTHEGFPAEEAKVGHEEGWGSCLNTLQGMYA